MVCLLLTRADVSYPVQPEVGKVGTNSPSFILPVAERSDGIKAFFTKASPAKAPAEKAKETKPKRVPAAKGPLEAEQNAKQETLDEMGDDSNAPNPSPGKRKLEENEKTGGKRTKIERKPMGGDKVSERKSVLIFRRNHR